MCISHTILGLCSPLMLSDTVVAALHADVGAQAMTAATVTVAAATVHAGGVQVAIAGAGARALMTAATGGDEDSEIGESWQRRLLL